MENQYSCDSVKAIIYGHSKDSDFRWKAASGGLTTELLMFLLKEKIVDYVVTSSQYVAGKKPQPVILSSPAQLKSVSGSNYCPVPMGLAIQNIFEQDGKYALVCLPCAARGIRALMHKDPKLAKRISFIITLLCNHTPSFHATYYLAKQYLGICKSSEIAEVRYRGEGWFGQATVTLQNGSSCQVPFSKYFTTSFSSSFFRPRCQMCLDHFGADADIAMGDADFVKYRNKGENTGETICFIHNQEVLQILQKMECQNRICLNSDIHEKEIMDIYGPLFEGGKTMIAARSALKGIVPNGAKSTLGSIKTTFWNTIRTNLKFYKKMLGNNVVFRLLLRRF